MAVNKEVQIQTSPATEIAQLREEVARLREELARIGRPAEAPKWERPSFGLSAGEVADLEMNGDTRNAFTGEKMTTDTERAELDRLKARRDRAQG